MKRRRKTAAQNTDYAKLARESATTIAEGHFGSHRGAFPEGGHVWIIYGNDGYRTDTRSQREVEIVREAVAYYGLQELGFGTDGPEGYTWVMFVHVPPETDVDLHQVVWDSWFRACGMKRNAA